MIRVVAIVLGLCAIASAQPTSEILRRGNESAVAGDWPRVEQLIAPLLDVRLPRVDQAELHRLAGLAAYFGRRPGPAEHHFLAYLELDLDAQLDPAIYPPDVVSFFNDVRMRHGAELRARRPIARRYWLLNLVPPGGQIQNAERTKALVIGGLLGAFAIGNVTTYLVLRSWCTRVSGDAGRSVTCDESSDHSSAAQRLRGLNIVTGIGLLATYVYGVYDGASGYRRRSREPTQPFVMPTTGGGVVGMLGSF